MHRYTARQIRLFYREAQLREARARADRIEDGYAAQTSQTGEIAGMLRRANG